MFKNNACYCRGEMRTMREEYTDYAQYVAKRHRFNDMVYHDSEVAAVRLAEKGIFDKTELFYPDKIVTEAEFVCLMSKLSDCGIENKNDDILTVGRMVAICAEVTDDTENAEQYSLIVDSNADKALISAAAKCVALGIVDKDTVGELGAAVTRALVADVLYRLANPQMRLVVPYDLGTAYREGCTDYLVKNSYTLNKSGIQLGTWPMYNWQAFAFKKLGKRPIDRVDFHKWVHNEPSEGEYRFAKFINEQCAQKMGSTVITSVEIAANLKWNPRFHKDMIPPFYEPDITNPHTREAAKRYLYAFVQEMLSKIGGDVILSVDYEVDWEMNLDREVTPESKWRASEWSKWYAEACEVARKAAADMNAADRLSMMVIYNNVNEMTKLGIEENQWMITCAEASDYIGIDVYYYNLVEDRTDPAKFMQDIRYLISNYSLGKPVMVVENGMPLNAVVNDEIQAGYFRNLFREFRFELGEGGFLDKKLDGYLFWDLVRNPGGTTGVFSPEGNPYPAGEVITKEIAEVESIRQYNPTLLVATEDMSKSRDIDISVESGTEFDCLTKLIKTDAGAKTLKITLQNEGTVFITVNGKYNYVSRDMITEHSIEISDGITDGINKIEIYFGNIVKPFTQTVKSVELI